MRTFLVFGVLLATATGAHAQAATPSEGVRYVFFDWGKVEVTRDGAATLDALAASYRPGQSISLTGYSDRSGPASSNRRTSAVRAEAVRDYLEGKGVPRRAMTAVGVGERDLLVPTEDGVREVQNRRVEIRVEGP